MSDFEESMKKNKVENFTYSTKKNILIVDDSEVNRKILVKILADEYELIEAGNGQEALDILRSTKNKVSLILLDIVMPVLDGYGFLEEFQKDEKLSTIPVIVSTLKDGEKDELDALTLGASDFLIKPYKPQIIKRRVANLLRLQESTGIITATKNDELTGVYNKEFFYTKGETLIRDGASKKYDIICCDIERFKLINDLFGMKIGDNLLKHVASIITHEIASEGICGRIGGDKFVCILPHQRQYANEKFDQIIKRVNTFSPSISINISFGIYVIEDITMPLNIMCDRAQLACNSIKGKYDVHYAYYNSRLMQQMRKEQNILDEMKSAIQEKQFIVYYQPKYDISTGKVAGAEALVRWKHPKNGFISPGDFIPLFEKNGFITELDHYIWNQVCQDIHTWIVEGKKYVPVSVNVSRVDIYNPNLIDIFKGLLMKYHLYPRNLHLEITESAYTENSSQLIEVVTKLKAIGFIIEMDDFGSGYSSLNMLSELPLDILKLDMKFIHNETAKNSSKNILSFVISLAKWMNLLVIAEGVETKEQLEILRNMDCNYVQGFYYAKPMNCEEFEEHLILNQVAKEEEIPKIPKIGSDMIHVISSKSNKIMMIVDDVELNRVILTRIFSKYFTIVEADNGKAAYNYILRNKENVDVILLDLVMPVMDGFQLLKKIKNNEKLNNIPVIVTSQASEESEAKALEMGAADFIAKPYNSKIALRRVRNVLKLQKKNTVFQRLQEMEKMAKTDVLTGLYNRAELEAQMNAFFSTYPSKKGIFLILDIDNFKLVNDCFGHTKGDEAIQKVASILTSYFIDDEIICRMGGDEFAIFIRQEYTEFKLNRCLERLCEHLCFMVENIHLTCSIGACESLVNGNDYQTLYQNADMALMSAKRQGKNQYQVYGPDTQIPYNVFFHNKEWIMEEAADAVLVCDAKDYNVLYMNGVACEIAKKSKKECLKKKCYEALWNRTTPCEHCMPIKKLTNEYFEYDVSTFDKECKYTVKTKLMDWNGKIARIQYIQDHHRREKKTFNNLNSYQKLMDFLPGGICSYHVNQAENFQFVSHHVLQMLDYTHQEFCDKFQNKFIHMVWHEDRERVHKEIALQHSKDTIECDYRIEKANGEFCYVHHVGRLAHDVQGQAIYFVTLINITTLQKKLEDLEKECEKLKKTTC